MTNDGATTNELLQRADRAIAESTRLIAQHDEAMWKAEQLDSRLRWIHYRHWRRNNEEAREE
jgi:hypothetical protein